MKFCPNCGAQLADESKFCMECGQKIEAAPAAPAPEMSYAPVPEMSYAPVQPEVPSYAPQDYAPVQPEAPQGYVPPAPQGYAPEAPQGFVPPAPQGYAPEAPQGYVPPAPQGYAPEAPQGFVPPAPQGYAPQNGYAPPAAPKQPKKGGKKTGLFIGIGVAVVAIIAVLLIVLLGGGGAAKDDPNLGVYNCVSYEVLGVSTEANGEWIELKAKNKATVSILETEFDGKWALEGNALTLTLTGADYEGTLSNGVIEIDLFGLVYTFAKDGAVVPTPTPASTPTPAVDEQPAESGDKGDAPVEEATPAPVADIPAFAVTEANYGDFTVVMMGAEYFDDIDGKDAIRFYYDFYNNSNTVLTPWWEIDFVVMQNGVECESTFDSYEDDVPEYGNEDLALRPGAANRCIGEYLMDPNSGAVTVEVSPSWIDGGPMTVVFDPQNLPGRPSPDFQIAPVAEPRWLEGRSDIGTIDGEYDIFIDNAEVAQGYDGETLVRVYFDFTNNSAEACSFFWACTVTAYQDGVELPTSWAAETVPEEDNFYTDVEPGASIRVAVVYEVRSANPIEVEINNTGAEGGLGAIYNFNS